MHILTNHLVIFSSHFFYDAKSPQKHIPQSIQPVNVVYVPLSLSSTHFPYSYSTILMYQVLRSASQSHKEQCRRITVAVSGRDTMKTTSTTWINVIWDNGCRDTCLYSDYTTGWIIQGIIHSRSKRCCSSPKCPDQLWGPQSLFHMYQGFFLGGVKWSGHQVYHSLSSTAEVKNKSNYTSTHPQKPSRYE